MLRRLPTPKPPLSPRAWAVIGFATVCVALVGCGGSPKGPPSSVDTAKPSPVAGIQDDTIYKPDQDPSERVRMMAASGAALIRVDLLWSQVARSRPANPTDPGDPAYQWEPYDRLLDVAKANNLEVMFAVYGTPAWAADPTVTLPKDGVLGGTNSVRPNDAADFGAFATAAARRFAPRGVRKWEAWNEPNIKLFLYPQYERKGDRWVASSPAVYSELLKRFYAGVKAADPSAIVAGGVFAPTGDRCGASCPVSAKRSTMPNRIKVSDFLAALDSPELRPRMDVVSHHPYPTSPPRETTPPNRDFIDLYNLDALSAAIDSTYLSGSKIWLTEYGFGTAAVDQNPRHFSPQEQATYIVDAFQRVRGNPRVELMVYYFLHDHADWKSGLLDVNGTPKPGLAAFALPFGTRTANATSSKAIRLIGQARAATGRTKVEIEWKSGDTWRRLTTVDTAVDGSFALSMRPPEAVAVRAVWDGATRSGERLRWTSPEVAVPALVDP